jgi:hypothetical protein
MSSTSLHRRLFPLVAATVVAVVVVGAESQASAQEWVGTEVSAVLPAVVLGSSASGATHYQSNEIVLRGPRFAVCDPFAADCRGLYSQQIDMNTSPRFELRVPLPASLSLRGHLWTVLDEDVDVSTRQGIVGTTLRHERGGDWFELGAGMAREVRQVHDAFGDVDVEGPQMLAVLAGVGTAVQVGQHMMFDLRLRGGLSVGDGAGDIYHCTLGVGFLWQ